MQAQNDLRQDDGGIGDRIGRLNRELETLAANADWSAFSAVLHNRDALLDRVPDADRAAVFEATLRVNDRIRKSAASARQFAADQLSALLRSREHSDRYESEQNA